MSDSCSTAALKERLEVGDRWLKEARLKRLEKGADWTGGDAGAEIRFLPVGIVKLMRMAGVDNPEAEASVFLDGVGDDHPPAEQAAAGAVDSVCRWGVVVGLWPINRRIMRVRLDDHAREVTVTVPDSFKFVIGQGVPVKLGTTGTAWFLACRAPWKRGRLPVAVVPAGGVA